MPIHVYYCAECAKVEYKLVSPSKGGCNKSSFHRWINLGVKGDIKYRCSKCRKEVEASRKPASYGCCQATFHEWDEA